MATTNLDGSLNLQTGSDGLTPEYLIDGSPISGTGMPVAPAGSLNIADGATWVPYTQVTNNPLYDWSIDTSATDPGAGNVKGNNSDLSLITEIYISSTSTNGANAGDVIKKGAKGDVFYYSLLDDNTNFFLAELQSRPVDNGGWFTVEVGVISSAGSFPDASDISTTIIASSPRAEDLRVDRLIDGSSVASAQNPTGLGPANAVQVEFGPAIGTGADPVQLTAAGALIFNEGGLYRLKVAAQAGRSGAAGTAELLLRALINGTQAGRTVAYRLSNSNVIIPFQDEQWLNLPSGVTVTYEIMRDSSGSNSGGLVGQNVTADPGAWNQDVSAAIRIERWSNV